MTSLLHHQRSTLLLAGAILTPLLVLTSACSSVPRQAPGTATAPRGAPDRPSGPDLESGAAFELLADRIADAALSLIASPYRTSGEDPEGFDCSGFTKFVFASVGITIPRTAARQASVGLWTAGDELARGDLVFFGRRRHEPEHVGLVVSEPGQPLTMIHAASSSGVVKTEITSNPYWVDRLLFGRRVLTSSRDREAAALATEPPRITRGGS
jgi:cell wall-associated NlpC family hydrolase